MRSLEASRNINDLCYALFRARKIYSIVFLVAHLVDSFVQTPKALCGNIENERN